MARSYTCTFCRDDAHLVVRVACDDKPSQCEHVDVFACYWCFRQIFWMHDEGKGLYWRRLEDNPVAPKRLAKEDRKAAIREVEAMLGYGTD